MRILVRRLFLAGLLCVAALCAVRGQEDSTVLPQGVRAEWDVNKASRVTTSTREKICINGLWRWQPSRDKSDRVPSANWGYFKVPGSWPGIGDYMQKDFQTVFAHPSWKREPLGSLGTAWYQREIFVPKEWAGRRIALSLEYLNSLAVIFVDGTKRGEVRFPGGELDITAALQPGTAHVLSLLVAALPLKDVLFSYLDTNAARESTSRVSRRGLCGDVFLASSPLGPRISDVRVDTSVRRGEITFDVALEGLAAERQYSFVARVTKDGRFMKEFTSPPFTGSTLSAGRSAFVRAWKPDALWDLHTPQNSFEVSVSLTEVDGSVLDTYYGARFGFREFWIDGRDFYLNGSRIFLSAVPLDNAQVGAALASYQGARETLERLKSIGINFVYTHNYDCQPGAHLSFEEILRAADDTGMLVSLTQPHFSNYDWKPPDADRTNGYVRHAEFYVRAAQNHPAVVAYGMSHNATGYNEDMNPDMIDGREVPRDQWSRNNVQLALRAEAIVKRLDSGRIVYHHASGNLGSMHPVNFYPNFVPSQELSDWFEHWATTGVKPVFLCEYGAPFTWDWTMYRGWYKGQREFGSATVPWEFCLAEWNAQFLGDRAFQISAAEAANLRWEAKQFRAGKVWHRWDYPNAVGSSVFDEQYPVFAMYLADNWPAYRTWGLSAISPWEYGHYWKLREGVDKRRKELAVDWENLQRPGLSADYLGERFDRMDMAFAREDWVPTAAGRALLRYNRPLLAYLAGKPDHFTSKDHIFVPGETVEKQLIVINNSRETVSGDCTWSLTLPQAFNGAKSFSVATGEQERVLLRFTIPDAVPPGEYALSARVQFSNGETQTDSFAIQVLPPPPRPESINAKVALFDPKGETGAVFNRMGIRGQSVDASSNLSDYDVLVVGKSALTTNGLAPDITRVRDGLKVVMFEQTSEVLEKRFGFRVEEYGLRRVFARVPDHPVLSGLAAEDLRDWRGEATILSSRLRYEMRPRYGPTVNWAGIPVTRLWRCGNRGNVASVLIEKPARGDFLPILDGGYDLQYSPLMEYREGRGMVLFCQMDVTGRTESDPAAEALARNILRYASDWKPTPVRKAVYVGESAGQRHFISAGVSIDSYQGGQLSSDQVLIAGPGAGRDLAASKNAVADWLKAGGRLLAIGLEQVDMDAMLPFKVGTTKREHISSFFESTGANSLLLGVGPADLLNRDPRELPLIRAGATVIGDGVLATATNANVVFCQLVPWQFDMNKQSNLKRTFRRASFAVARLLANHGVHGSAPILERFHTPVGTATSEPRWLTGLYLDQPEEWDDPYRFFRW